MKKYGGTSDDAPEEIKKDPMVEEKEEETIADDISDESSQEETAEETAGTKFNFLNLKLNNSDKNDEDKEDLHTIITPLGSEPSSENTNTEESESPLLDYGSLLSSQEDREASSEEPKLEENEKVAVPEIDELIENELLKYEKAVEAKMNSQAEQFAKQLAENNASAESVLGELRQRLDLALQQNTRIWDKNNVLNEEVKSKVEHNKELNTRLKEKEKNVADLTAELEQQEKNLQQERKKAEEKSVAKRPSVVPLYVLCGLSVLVVVWIGWLYVTSTPQKQIQQATERITQELADKSQEVEKWKEWYQENKSKLEGVSQTDYDDLKEERDSALAQKTTAETNYQSAQENLLAKDREIAKLKEQLASKPVPVIQVPKRIAKKADKVDTKKKTIVRRKPTTISKVAKTTPKQTSNTKAVAVSKNTPSNPKPTGAPKHQSAIQTEMARLLLEKQQIVIEMEKLRRHTQVELTKTLRDVEVYQSKIDKTKKL